MTAKKTTASEPALPDLPLPASHDVTGGDGKISSSLTQIQQLQHDTNKATISNIRA